MKEKLSHPVSHYLGESSVSSQCPGCGIGSVLFALLDACFSSGLEPPSLKWIVGTGCLHQLGQRSGLTFPSCAVEDGRLGEALLKEVLLPDGPPGSPATVVLMNNLDLFLSGAGDWLAFVRERISADYGSGRPEMTGVQRLPSSYSGLDYRRKMNFSPLAGSAPIVVIHLNNCLYVSGETGISPATPLRRMSVDGEYELPFNLPLLFARLNPELMARWTPLQAGWLRETLVKALLTPGLSFIEVVIPCVVWAVKENRVLSAGERIAFYDRWTVFYAGESLAELDLRQGKIIVGELVNRLPLLEHHRGKQRSLDWQAGEHEIHLSFERCQGCGLCLDLCQAGVFAAGKEKNQRGYIYPLVAHPEKCLDCGLCEMLCPELAIRVERKAGPPKKEHLT
ncbi:4Fe-4S dicluster domain-containing protein [Candidatus Aminicenantes bacterium AC-334-K16]|nr:4Fe-4S dicluster domain-containing protein [Candidatus Aminicenantes bacterium AC-334-K16]